MTSVETEYQEHIKKILARKKVAAHLKNRSWVIYKCDNESSKSHETVWKAFCWFSCEKK
jgi:hypothetical protein